MGLLKAAADKVDLEPVVGTWLCGFSARTAPSCGQHDTLYAQAVLLDDGDSKCAIVSCDLLGFSSAQCWEMRARIASRSTIPISNIIICCTHTHSGPACASTRGLMGQTDEIWQAHAMELIVSMVAQLEHELVPAKLTTSSTQVEGIGYNRDDDTRPIDTELMTVALDTLDGGAIATLINYATHAVTMGPSNLLFSGDFPAAAVRQLSELRGGVSLFLQGACGDVDPLVYQQHGWGSGTFEVCEQMGRTLATHALSSIKEAVWEADVKLQSASSAIELPVDVPPSTDELLKWVADWEHEVSHPNQESAIPIQFGNAETFLMWAGELLDALSKESVPASYKTQISVMTFNQFTIVAAPFEAYSDIGMRIKQQLGAGSSLFVGYANGENGYLPSRWAKQRGGYGADISCRFFTGLLTAFGLGADEQLIEACVQLAQRMRA